LPSRKITHGSTIAGDKASSSESNTIIDFEILKTNPFCIPAKNYASMILWVQVRPWIHPLQENQTKDTHLQLTLKILFPNEKTRPSTKILHLNRSHHLNNLCLYGKTLGKSSGTCLWNVYPHGSI